MQPINAGQLDRLISIQRRTDTRDDHGEPIATWSRIGRKRWAQYRPMSGNERYVADQFVALEQVEFQVRWAKDLEDLNPKDRIIYPATDTITDRQIYEIMGVLEIGRREGFRIMTARRQEA